MRPPPWPPYLVAAMTFLAMIMAFGLVAQVMMHSAVERGALPAMPRSGEFEVALDIAFGSPARKLAASIVVNCVLIFIVATVASAAGLTTRMGRGIRRRMCLQRPRWIDAAVAILGLIGVTTGLDAIVGLLGLRDYGTLASIKASLAGLSTPEQLAFALLIGIGPGVTEELFFRGYMFNRVAVSQGFGAALVTSSIVFGLFHADPVHSVLATAMGFYLGLCLFYTGSIWVPIVAHIANNVMATLTTDIVPTDLQAVLLIPLGAVACGSALVLLRRSPGALHVRPLVW